MVRQVRAGILDFIGAARPSIADPLLPRKIEEGRFDDIRECIGCNICVASDMTISPIRCTQNPAMGEEWRRGWHPERILERESDARIMVVGGGPAGLEAARALGQRGYGVTLVEARRELGGRVAREANLPRLATWRRVADYRLAQLSKMPNVEVFQQSEVGVEDIVGSGMSDIVLATGAVWRRDAVGRSHTHPIPIEPSAVTVTPDDVMDGAAAGRLGSGSRVIVFDDDHYYLGGVLAEQLVLLGHHVRLITPAAYASEWTVNTLERDRIQRHLYGLGVSLHLNRTLVRIDESEAVTACVYTGSETLVPADAVLLVTGRLPVDDLYQRLLAREDEWSDFGIRSVQSVGDAYAPATIASAVWSGRRFAEEFDGVAAGAGGIAYRREHVALE